MGPQENLLQYMCWARDPNWGRDRFPVLAREFYEERRLYLPPLTLADLLAADGQVGRKPGVLAHTRPHYSSWGRWLLSWRELVQRARCSRDADANDHGPAWDYAIRLARRILGDCANDKLTWKRWGVNALIKRHLAVLDAGRSAVLPSAESAVVARLERMVLDDEHPFEFMGPTDCAALARSSPSRIDPHVYGLLPVHLPTMRTTLGIHGRALGGRQSRIVPSRRGEFLERGPGRLPEDLARLAPLELLFLKEQPDYFMQRVSEGSLMQQYGRGAAPSRMQSSILLDLHLDEMFQMHRFPDPPNPPVISRYRALVCSVCSYVSARAASNEFRLVIRIRHSAPAWRGFSDQIYKSGEIHTLAESPAQAFYRLCVRQPSLLSTCIDLPKEASEAPEGPFDVCLRITLGQKSNAGQHATSDIAEAVTCRSLGLIFEPDGSWRYAAGPAAPRAMQLMVGAPRPPTPLDAITRELLDSGLGRHVTRDPHFQSTHLEITPL